ncbi:prolyl 4-hydroxylase subunit alpha-3 [Cricetulus griseus]|nr:prolyl 4-hydroxylase subunit alpha-3 [Cricetulus griseus]
MCMIFLYRDLNSKTTLKFVHTSFHGVGHDYVQLAFQVFGFKPPIPVPEQKDPDPEFSTVKCPNPEEGESVLELSLRLAEKENARIVLATDPDADRLAVAELQENGHWKVFTGNELAALFGWWMFDCWKENKSNADVKNVYMLATTVSSKILKAIALKEGFHFEETLPGFKWIGSRIKDLLGHGKEVLFAFEESIEQLSKVYEKYGYHMSKTSYFLCYDPPTIKTIFERIRNFESPKEYPKFCGAFAILHVRDITTGYDSSQPNKKSVLPVSKNSQMITFTFQNGCVATLRTSGTEPKIKYYAEMCASPGQSDTALLEEELKKLIDALIENFLEPSKNGLIWRSVFYDKVLSLHEDVTIPVVNPLLAFTLIKRLQSDWRNVVHSLEATENIRALKDGYEKVEQDLPAFEDLEGAARALMRLQDVYMLNVKGLAQGVFQRVTGSSITDLYSPRQLFSLTADDCFQVGKVAYDMGDYYHAIPWLEEAVSLFRRSYGEWKTEDEASLDDALDYLAFACFQGTKLFIHLCYFLFGFPPDPDNKRMARNVLKYERLLSQNALQMATETVIQRPNVPNLQTRDTYEGLCQTLGSQPTHYQNPRLYCSYETNSSPYLLLQPARKEVIHLRPFVALYHDFVSDAEAQKIRELAEPWLQRSVVASGEKQLPVEYRISKSAWLKDTVDPMLGTLDHRIAALTGLDIQPPYAEYLQVVNYGIGGHYEPHFDHATSPSSPLYRMKSGNRVATFMIYLSAVEAGGATAFIYANFSVPVVKNAALFWWNLHRSGEGDGDTLHAGCPVLVGDKWVANKWIHEYGQEFRRPCSTNPED